MKIRLLALILCVFGSLSATANELVMDKAFVGQVPMDPDAKTLVAGTFRTSEWTDYESDYVRRALSLLFQMKGNGGSPLHREVFGGPVDGRVYKKWILSRVRRIVKDSHSCGELASGCVNGIDYFFSKLGTKGRRKIRVTPLGLEAPLVELLRLIIHEARHTDGYMHVDCEPGAYMEGEVSESAMARDPFLEYGRFIAQTNPEGKNCDDSVYSPYAISSMWLSNILEHCTNCVWSDGTYNRTVYSLHEDLSRVIPHRARALLLSDGVSRHVTRQSVTAWLGF